MVDHAPDSRTAAHQARSFTEAASTRQVERHSTNKGYLQAAHVLAENRRGKARPGNAALVKRQDTIQLTEEELASRDDLPRHHDGAQEKLREFVIVSIVVFGSLLYFFEQSASASRVKQPHYELAFSDDIQLCSKLKRVYNKLLEGLLQSSGQFFLPLDEAITDFGVSRASRFAQIGLTLPKTVKVSQLAIDKFTNSYTNLGDPVVFYSATIGRNIPHRILVQKDSYRGNDPSTTITILKAGLPPALGASPDMVDPNVPVPQEDVEATLSVLSLSAMQKQGSPSLSGEYVLRNWPNIDALIDQHRRALDYYRKGILYGPPPSVPDVPALSTSGFGVTIRPFQSDSQALYFIVDQYASAREIQTDADRPGLSAVTVLMRYDGSDFQDVCYLVISPSKLAQTLEGHDVRN